MKFNYEDEKTNKTIWRLLNFYRWRKYLCGHAARAGDRCTVADYRYIDKLYFDNLHNTKSIEKTLFILIFGVMLCGGYKYKNSSRFISMDTVKSDKINTTPKAAMR
jgi:hypothetical protein